jgi:hypothetical protein
MNFERFVPDRVDGELLARLRREEAEFAKHSRTSLLMPFTRAYNSIVKQFEAAGFSRGEAMRMANKCEVPCLTTS